MTSNLDQDLLDAAGWSAAMDDHCQAFQAVWAEHGAVVSQTPAERESIRDSGMPQEMQDESLQVVPDFEDIPPRIDDLFDTFHSGRIEQAAAIYDGLGTAAELANENIDAGLGTLQVELGASWRGDAATGFGRWLGDMQRACDNMSDVALSARELMNAYRQLLQSYRSDILTLIDDVQVRLTNAGLAEERRKLTMLSTICTIGMGLLGATSVQGAAVTVAGALVSLAHSDNLIQVGGEEEGDVILSMLTEGEKINTDADAAAGRIIEGLLALGSYVTDIDGRLGEIRPGRPSLITDTGFDPGDFQHEEQPPDITDRVRRDDLVPEPPRDEDRDSWSGNPPPGRPEDPDEFGLGIDPGPPPLADDDPYPEQ